MEMGLGHFIIMSLAIFRITRLLVYDTITEGIRERFYEEVQIGKETYLNPKNIIGALLLCHWCTGFWVTVIVYTLYLFFPTVMGHVIVIFGAAGLAAIGEWMKRDV